MGFDEFFWISVLLRMIEKMSRHKLSRGMIVLIYSSHREYLNVPLFSYAVFNILLKIPFQSYELLKVFILNLTLVHSLTIEICVDNTRLIVSYPP